MRNIVLIWPRVTANRSKAVFQRPKYFSSYLNVYLLTAGEVCEEIRRNAKGSKTCSKMILGLDRIIFPIWAALNVISLSRKVKVDVVYTTNPSWILFSGFLVKILGYRWVADLIDDPALEVKVFSLYKRVSRNTKVKLVYYRFYCSLIKRTLKYADVVINVGLNKDSLRNDYHLDLERTISITNGVDLDVVKDVRKEFDDILLKDDHFKIVYVGVVNLARGIRTIIKCAAYLQSRIPSFRIYLVGPTQHEDKGWLAEVIRKMDLKDAIEIVGEVNHKKALGWIYRSDVCLFVYLGTDELQDRVYPIKVFEYMAMGKVAIVSNVCGINEIIRHRRNGLIINPPDDPVELAECILEIYCNPGLRSRIEKQTQKDVKEFIWDRINRRIYRTIVEAFGFDRCN